MAVGWRRRRMQVVIAAATQMRMAEATMTAVKTMHRRGQSNWYGAVLREAWSCDILKIEIMWRR
jgi:hypothetical protein